MGSFLWIYSPQKFSIKFISNEWVSFAIMDVSLWFHENHRWISTFLSGSGLLAFFHLTVLKSTSQRRHLLCKKTQIELNCKFVRGGMRNLRSNFPPPRRFCLGMLDGPKRPQKARMRSRKNFSAYLPNHISERYNSIFALLAGIKSAKSPVWNISANMGFYRLKFLKVQAENYASH